MNLYKTIILFTLTAFILTGCADNDEPKAYEPVEIGLCGDGSNVSRATQTLNMDYLLWVTSLYHFDDEGFFYLKEAPYQSNGSVWRGTPPQYYPSRGKLDFVAVAAKNKKHLPSITYTPSPTTKNLGDDQHIQQMVLDFTPSKCALDGTDDVLLSAVTDDWACGLDASPVVPLHFIHLLTNVRFSFTAATEEAATFFWIRGVDLINAYSTGKVTATRQEDHPWDIEWSNLSNTSKKHFDSAFCPGYGEGEKPHIDFYVPPQATRQIKYQVHYNYKVDSETFTAEMTFAPVKIPKPSQWEAGMRYTYDITIKMLPHISFEIELIDGQGTVLDTWIEEPTINI